MHYMAQEKEDFNDFSHFFSFLFPHESNAATIMAPFHACSSCHRGIASARVGNKERQPTQQGMRSLPVTDADKWARDFYTHPRLGRTISWHAARIPTTKLGLHFPSRV